MACSSRLVAQRRLKRRVGRHRAGRLARIATFGGQTIEGDRQPLSSALRGPIAVAAVGQLVRAHGQQERAEPIAMRRDRRQSIALEESQERPWTTSAASSNGYPLRRTNA
jgi:hypothetical protein